MVVLGSTAALVLTNPSLQDYQAYAGDQLVELATQELCGHQGLPMVLRLWVKDCPALVAQQKATLGFLAAQATTQRNFGVMSVFTTQVGGQQLLPALQLPRYRVTTLGLVGQFVTIEARSDLLDTK